MRLSRCTFMGWAIGVCLSSGWLLLMSASSVRARSDETPAFIAPDPAAAENLLRVEVDARRQRIEEAITQAPASEWSAEYYEGDGLGENVRVTLDAKIGVAATWRGCMGMYGANEGEVDASNPREFAFRFRHPNRESGQPVFGTFPERVHAVRWGKRHYLLPEDRGIEFVNAMHHGMEPRDRAHGLFLLAKGDERKPVSGLPELPPTLLALVRAKPLTLRVRSVETPIPVGHEFPTCLYRLHLDLPPGETLPLGTTLHPLRDSRRHYASADVKEVESDTVIAEITEYSACSKVRMPPRPGLSLTTGAYPSPDE